MKLLGKTGRLAIAVLLVAGGLTNAAGAPMHGKARHVVLVVWDGMRPDFISEANSPTLWRLMHEGVNFRHHHSVFPTLTNVNSTALATGMFPAHSNVLANYEYRPELDPTKFIRTDKPEVVRKADGLSGGHYLHAATIAELVRAAGGRTAVAGGKTTALLHDRNPPNDGASVTLFSGEALPPSATQLLKTFGPFPDKDHIPGTAGDVWTTRVLTESLWKDGVPEYSVLWLSEPDRVQHARGPGSEAALTAIKSSDANLALVLDALDKKGVRDQTDIFVASDHGFSTMLRAIDLRALLQDAGFAVVVDGDVSAKRGEIRIVGNGGTLLFYITDHDPEVAGRLIEWLQKSEFVGTLFTRAKTEGVFSLGELHLDTADAPDVLMTFRWTDAKNSNGAPGMIYLMLSKDIVTGSHGTLSKFDLHNTLIAAGPDFARGEVDEFPTNNLDVAATIAHLLGLKTPQPLDGRVLHEALIGDTTAKPIVEEKVIEAMHNFPAGRWRQSLQIEKIGDEIYVDQGGGELQPK